MFFTGFSDGKMLINTNHLSIIKAPNPEYGKTGQAVNSRFVQNGVKNSHMLLLVCILILACLPLWTNLLLLEGFFVNYSFG